MKVLQRSQRSHGEKRTGSGGGFWHASASRDRILAPLLVVLLVAGVLAARAVSGSSRAKAGQPTTLNVANEALAARLSSSAPTVPPTTAPPAVAPMGALRDPSAIVNLAKAVTPAQLHAIGALKGVQAVEVVDLGTVQLLGAPAVTMGVDPSTFRNFTPQVTASADQLWQYISDGSLASSFDMSQDRKLTLGVEVPVAAAGSAATTDQWLGAFMSIGLPGIDMVVSHQTGGALGLSPDSGLIVSAPSADAFTLQTAIKSLAPGASVVLMRPGLAIGSLPGSGGKSVVTAAQVSTALTAALSRVGVPYVWGGTGPHGFDCSGLVGWAFAAAGVSMPRTAASQALTGPKVPLNELEPGDLLFWTYDPSDPGFIDHVAIYLGNGQMIEAPETGSDVHVVPLRTNDLAGAVRVDPAVAARMGGPWLR